MDLLISAKDLIPDVLLLHTVLKELRRTSAEDYERARELLVTPPAGVRAAIFSNENRRETYVERAPVGENEEEYRAKLVIAAVQWLTKRWAPSATVPVLLTDDPVMLQRYREAGLECVAISEYASDIPRLLELYSERDDSHGLIDAPDSKPAAMDIDAEAGETTSPQKTRFHFPDYIPERKVRAGLRAGRLLKGTYRLSPYNMLEASVSVSMDAAQPEVRTKVLLIGRESQNRATEGDVVVIQVLPESEWRSSPNVAVQQDDMDEDIGDDDESEPEREPVAQELPETNAPAVPCGRVVAIARRSWRPYCGSISSSSFTGGDRALFLPIDRKVPKIQIRSRRMKDLLGQRLIVVVDKWDRGSLHPSGHVIKEIGNSGDRAAEKEVILVEHGIPTRKFSPNALACLPSESWAVTSRDVKARLDLRTARTICSVDPPGCTDIDDALHFHRLNENEIEIGVHIADVTWFVKHDSALDKEASERGTTVYLVDDRIEMLPSRLSGNFCSLMANVERLAFSTIMKMDNDGNLIGEPQFCRTVIKSKAALTYQLAQERIDAARKALAKDAGADVDPITTSLLGLAGIARRLRERRTAAGALSLASPEVRFNIAEFNDSSTVSDAYMYEIRETNKMVEEFMLLANIVVAKKIYKHFPQCAMLRRHPKPSDEMFEPVINVAKAAGFEIDVTNSKRLNDSLAEIDEKARQAGDDYLGTLLRILCTRCMTQAVYFSSGEVADPQYLHYGLAAGFYTHFTSPIRRYADVIVHRLLAACIGDSPLPENLQNSKRMHEIAESVNERHTRALFASRASTAFYAVLLFKEKTLKDKALEEPARIVRILGNGLVVLVPRYGVEGVVHMHESLEPKVNDIATELSIKTGKVYKILSTVRVRISVDTAPERSDRVMYELVN